MKFRVKTWHSGQQIQTEILLFLILKVDRLWRVSVFPMSIVQRQVMMACVLVGKQRNLKYF